MVRGDPIDFFIPFDVLRKRVNCHLEPAMHVARKSGGGNTEALALAKRASFNKAIEDVFHTNVVKRTCRPGRGAHTLEGFDFKVSVRTTRRCANARQQPRQNSRAPPPPNAQHKCATTVRVSRILSDSKRA